MIRSILFFLLIFLSLSRAQATQVNDSLAAEQLTRAVQYWQQGHPADAYHALDSVMTGDVTPANAQLKIKASLWTATYLEEQKKLKPAARFLDSALTWASQFARGEELRKVYESYAQWHLLTGNTKAAFKSQEAAYTIQDSLRNRLSLSEKDSLLKVINSQKQQAQQKKAAEAKAAELQKHDYKNFLPWLSAALILLLFWMLLRVYANLQKIRRQKPAAAKEDSKPGLVKTAVPETKIKQQPVYEPAPSLPPSVPVSTNNKDLTSRLSEVELVLIRAETLGRYSNSEWKSVRNLLNEYLTQLPLILKNLDDAIAKNETAPIMQGLEYLRPYLQAFGMNNTLLLIREIEDEANEAKASKLLSRVFQIRNHTRRAADEAKSILEKFS